MKQYEMVALQVVLKTHFFSSILVRTKRVKFLSSMKPIINAMAPPTAEAMMVASVLSTTLTADINERPEDWWWKNLHINSLRRDSTKWAIITFWLPVVLLQCPLIRDKLVPPQEIRAVVWSPVMSDAPKHTFKISQKQWGAHLLWHF